MANHNFILSPKCSLQGNKNLNLKRWDLSHDFVSCQAVLDVSLQVQAQRRVARETDTLETSTAL